MSDVDSQAVAPDTRGLNFFDEDPALKILLHVHTGSDLTKHLTRHLELLGYRVANGLDEHATLANANPPVLHHRDKFGRDHQWIEYHPSYQILQRAAFGEFRMHAMSHCEGILGWSGRMPTPAKHAFTYLLGQAEFGLGCPVNVTDTTIRLISKFGSDELKEKFLPNMLASSGSGLWQGAQFMTEKEGGSDVGQARTRAEFIDGKWLIYGDKWFCSNADADVCTLLARPIGAPSGTNGLGLFLVPRLLDTGQQNHYRIVRLKDKLGSRSMPSGEISFEGAEAYVVGELDQGFRQMTEMINWSRLSNGVKSSALMKRAVHDARVVATNREVFGSKIAGLPLGKRQLIKLSLPAEQSLTMWMFVASLLDLADSAETTNRQHFADCVRLATPVLKMRATRDARQVTADAMEMRGGCGYIEDFVNPRLVRDAMLGSIWEGTSNVVAIDAVQRAIGKKGCLSALVSELQSHINELSSVGTSFLDELKQWLDRCSSFASHVAQTENEELYRQVVSALYHISTAILMAYEAQVSGYGDRLLWSRLVIDHRLSPYSPVEAPPPRSRLMEQLVSRQPVDIEQANELIS